MTWISVKDRLPEENSWVLCTDGKSQYKKIYERGIFYDDEFFCYTPIGIIENVTHWMPLPEPPKSK